MDYLIIILSLAGIVIGADFLVSGAVSVARRFNVSDFVIGATIIGIGTSLPELVVSVTGAIEGSPDVAIGNVVGSNIFNVFGILGLTSILFPATVTRNNLKFEMPYCLMISVLLLLLVFNFFTGGDAVIGRVDGTVLLILFGVYMYLSFRGEGKPQSGTDEEERKKIKLALPVVKIVGGLAALVVGSRFFVDSAVNIAKALGVSEAFISITLIACGTSIPELAASLAAAIKKNTQMALGNIVGSNIFNASLILGAASMITPLPTSGITMADYLVMIASAAFPMLLGIRGKISRAGGAVLFLIYIAYMVYLVKVQGIGA